MGAGRYDAVIAQSAAAARRRRAAVAAHGRALARGDDAGRARRAVPQRQPGALRHARLHRGADPRAHLPADHPPRRPGRRPGHGRGDPGRAAVVVPAAQALPPRRRPRRDRGPVRRAAPVPGRQADPLHLPDPRRDGGDRARRAAGRDLAGTGPPAPLSRGGRGLGGHRGRGVRPGRRVCRRQPAAPAVQPARAPRRRRRSGRASRATCSPRTAVGSRRRSCPRRALRPARSSTT